MLDFGDLTGTGMSPPLGGRRLVHYSTRKDQAMKTERKKCLGLLSTVIVCVCMCACMWSLSIAKHQTDHDEPSVWNEISVDLFYPLQLSDFSILALISSNNLVHNTTRNNSHSVSLPCALFHLPWLIPPPPPPPSPPPCTKPLVELTS